MMMTAKLSTSSDFLIFNSEFLDLLINKLMIIFFFDKFSSREMKLVSAFSGMNGEEKKISDLKTIAH